jgi:hypothetical protein
MLTFDLLLMPHMFIFNEFKLFCIDNVQVIYLKYYY